MTYIFGLRLKSISSRLVFPPSHMMSQRRQQSEPIFKRLLSDIGFDVPVLQSVIQTFFRVS